MLVPRKTLSKFIPRTIKDRVRKLLHIPSERSRALSISDSNLGFGPYSEFEAGPGAAVPISTVAPFHNSIGDISTAQVTQNYLAAVGIPSYSTSFWDNQHPTTIIGGGEILGFPKVGAWRFVKPLFLPQGRHILNAVGFDVNGDRSELWKLQDYKYVSARDELIASQFSEYCDNVALVPCPATLQMGIPLALLQSLPRHEMLEKLEPKKYIVVHRHPTLARVSKRLRAQGHTLVVVDMQAHAKHPWGRRDVVLPSTHSPEVIRGLVGSASAVITASLHLAIFAIGEAVPFAAILDESVQSAKVRRYLDRANLGHAMGRENDDLLDIAMRTVDKISQVSIAERTAARAHLSRLVAAVRAP